MSESSTESHSGQTMSRYQSFASLRAAHNVILKRHRREGETPAVMEEVANLIRIGQGTGVLLDAEEDRWESQSLLDYWSTMMYRAGHMPPDATLDEFDPDLAPEIPDALCPYVGLHAFQESTQNVFYGRERLVQDMVGLLQESRLLSVVGASGSGKSSLVRAGLLSALKAGAVPGSQSWHYYRPIVPGSNPLAVLTRLIEPADVEHDGAIQRRGDRFQQDTGHLCCLVDDLHDSPVVIVVDQFEELFTLCTDDRNRRAFVDNLVRLAQSSNARHTIIMTMRADFESQVARLSTLQPLFEKAQVRVTPMSAAELREAIDKPAARVGLRFEEGIVDALLRDILGEPAALPLLQFTLLRLWESRERNRITWDAYRRLGGGRLALARSADEFYERLIPEEQLTARRILLRMVRPGAGLEVTSNRVRREALYEAGEARDRVDRVLERLVNEAHLVYMTTGDRPTDTQVEVAHEALVRNWPRLVGWLDEDRESIRQRLRLSSAAQEWAELGRDPSALLPEALLERALRHEDLNELEAAYVQASQEALEAERIREEKARRREWELAQARELVEEQQRRAEAESRAAGRLRLLLVVLAVVFLLIGGGSYAWVKQRAAQAEQEANQRAVLVEQDARLAAAAVSAETRTARIAQLEVVQDARATLAAQLVVVEAREAQAVATQGAVRAKLATVVAAQQDTPELPVIEFLQVVPAEVIRGDAGSVELTWSILGKTTDIQIGNVDPAAADLSPQGTLSVRVDRSTEFVLTASNGSLTARASVKVTVIEPTPTPVPTSTPTLVPVQVVLPADVAIVRQSIALFAEPDAGAVTLGFANVDQHVTVMGRAASGSWLYVRNEQGVEGFAWLPYLEWSGDLASMPIRVPTTVYEVEYLGCQSHDITTGSVKGQVLDTEGAIVRGAQVRIEINGLRWDAPDNPATTNVDGWYEWILSLNQTVQFVALTIDGRPVAIEPPDFEVFTRSRCFQRVNFRER
jgi:conflict system STAND superfamily ATPase